MQAVVLAAGAGRRLRPLSLTRSKALAPLCGRPLLDWLLSALADAGCDDFVVVVADLDDDVARYCRAWPRARRLQLALQAERLGTAHALAAAAPFIEGTFLQTACDTLLDAAVYAEFASRHRAARVAGTLFLEPVTAPEKIRRTAIVRHDGPRILDILEKPEPEQAPSRLGSIPVYLFEPALLDHLAAVQPSPRGEYELQDAIRAVIATGAPVVGYQVPQRWQVTDCADLLALNRQWLARGATRTDPRATCVGPVQIGAGAVLGPGCTLGPDAVIEDGAVLGAGVTVRRALVLNGARVPDGALVEDCVLAE